METFRQKLGYKERRPAKNSLESRCQKEAESFERRDRLIFFYSSAISTEFARSREISGMTK
jgi:hypothetical protein